MSGPAPKPTHLKVIQGNPGKRPFNLDEFRPDTAIPVAPRHLKGEALKEWKRITVELAKYGMISEVDRDALAMICTLWGRHVTAENLIERMAKKELQELKKNGKPATLATGGLFVKTPNGFPVQSPWVSVSNKAMEMYRMFLSEFGLSPAQRTRVTPGNPLQPDLFDLNKPDQSKWDQI